MTGRRLVANTLLAGGYAAAVWAALRFVPMWRQRRGRRFLAFQAGTAAVTAGHALAGRPREAAINAAVLVGLGVAWVATNRRR